MNDYVLRADVERLIEEQVEIVNRAEEQRGMSKEGAESARRALWMLELRLASLQSVEPQRS